MTVNNTSDTDDMGENFSTGGGYSTWGPQVYGQSYSSNSLNTLGQAIANSSAVSGIISLGSSYPISSSLGQISNNISGITWQQNAGTVTIPKITNSWDDWTAKSPFWPFRMGDLSEEEQNLIRDFKVRNPDFDDYDTEIDLILEQFPSMSASPIYLSLLYDLAKRIRKYIYIYVTKEKNKNDDTSSEL